MDLLTLDETVASLHQPIATVRFWRATNDLTKPQGRRMGRRVMYRQGDLEHYVSALFATIEHTP